jgi:hypothetical protein
MARRDENYQILGEMGEFLTMLLEFIFQLLFELAGELVGDWLEDFLTLDTLANRIFWAAVILILSAGIWFEAHS